MEEFIILPRQGCTVPCPPSQLFWWLFQALVQRLSCASFKGRGHWADLNHIGMDFFKVLASQKKIPHWDIWRMSNGKEGLRGFLSRTWFLIYLYNLWTSFALSSMTGSGSFKWILMCLLQTNLGQFYNSRTKFSLVVSRASVKCVCELIVNCGSGSVFQSSFTNHRERPRKKTVHRGWQC